MFLQIDCIKFYPDMQTKKAASSILDARFLTSIEYPVSRNETTNPVKKIGGLSRVHPCPAFDRSGESAIRPAD